MKASQLRILVIDDDQDFLLQQAAVLRGAGHTVMTAESAEDGEKKIREGGMDVVVVDLMMERNDDGFRLCYISKKLAPERRVVMVTGVTGETGIEFDASTKEERSWIKADQLLAKPVRPEQLLKAVTV